MSIIIEPGALDALARHVPRAHAYAVIADSNTRPLYAERVARQLGNSQIFHFPAGEANKTRETWAALTDAMLAHELGRDACVIAVGGGVTCDLAGFVAATYLRGVPVVHVPTSLLAMIDAAIGGKTGVDVPAGKNLVGAFHPPFAVVIDAVVLNSLPDAELSNGLAEAIKHGAIADVDYLDWIADAAPELFERRLHSLDSLIRRSVDIKSACVAEDPREAGKRAILNFGHTIGHAIERVSDYAVPHGHAVALGMLVEAQIGVAMGIAAADTPQRIRRALAAVRLPQELRDVDVRALLDATRTDKKRRAGAVRYVLLERAGRVARNPDDAWTWAVPDDVVTEVLTELAV